MTMTVTMLSGCGGTAANTDSGSNGQAETESNGEVETINVTYFSFNNFDDTAMVEEEVNKISEEKIGVKVKLNAMEGGQYMSQQTMLLSGSEDIDLIVTPLVTDAMNSGAFADMTDLVEEYGQDIKVCK